MQSKSLKFIVALTSAAAFLPRVGLAMDIPTLGTLETEVGNRRIIPASQIQNFVRSFGAVIEQRPDGTSFVSLRGWVPNECKSMIDVTLGAPGTENIYDAEAHAYPLHVEAHNQIDAAGNVVTPEVCFGANPATACKLSLNPSERNCTPLNEIAPLVATHSLTESGDVVHRVASTEMDPSGTGEALPPTTVRTLVHHTGAAEIAAQAAEEAAREEKAQLEGICARAAEGDADAINELRGFAGMVTVANRLEEKRLATMFDGILDMAVNNLTEATEKGDALWAFAEDNADYKRRVGEALMKLSDAIKDDLEAGENDDDVRFDRRRLTLREHLLSDARRLGARGALMAVDRLAFEQLAFAAEHPDRDGRNYRQIRRKVERLLAQKGHVAKMARHETRANAEERPFTRMYLDGNRLLGAEVGRRGERSGGIADQMAQRHWSENASRGEYNDASEGSTGYGASYFYGASPNQATYAPYAMPMPYAYW